MIGLGVGIDYALFIVTRHREHLHQGHTVEDAAGRAIATAGQAVLFAGTTVVIAICGLQFVGIPMVSMMGYATAVVVAVSVIAAITLLPAFMGFAGHKIDSWRVPFVKVSATGDEHAFASRWSRHVARHPWRYLLGSLALLGTLAVPFASIRLGMTDHGNDPTDRTTRKSYDLLAEGFGRGFNGPLLLIPRSHQDGILATAEAEGESAGMEAGPASWTQHVSAKLKYSLGKDLIRRLVSQHGIVAPTRELALCGTEALPNLSRATTVAR